MSCPKPAVSCQPITVPSPWVITKVSEARLNSMNQGGETGHPLELSCYLYCCHSEKRLEGDWSEREKVENGNIPEWMERKQNTDLLLRIKKTKNLPFTPFGLPLSTVRISGIIGDYVFFFSLITYGHFKASGKSFSFKKLFFSFLRPMHMWWYRNSLPWSSSKQ